MKKVRPRPLCPARLPDPGEDGRRFARDRMILTLSPEASRPRVEAMLAEKGLTVRYRMKSGPVLAVQTARPLSRQAWETLARELEREEGVLRVERDILNEPHGSGPRRCEK